MRSSVNRHHFTFPSSYTPCWFLLSYCNSSIPSTVGRESAYIFFKRPEGKYFQLKSQPLSPAVVVQGWPQTISNDWAGCVPVKVYLQNQVAGRIKGHSLHTLAWEIMGIFALLPDLAGNTQNIFPLSKLVP